MLAGNHSNVAIGRALFIAPDTVRCHVRKAMVKLDAATRTEAVQSFCVSPSCPQRCGRGRRSPTEVE